MIEFGIGIHTGTVMYGNLGTRGLIGFIVIGEAAKEAARIEAKCKEFGEASLVSYAYPIRLQRSLRPHGTFDLRNIGGLIKILSPAAQL